ncbi:hypothetical protein QEM11_004175 [Pseudomonas putida]|nr:hypothetical protein [Pseudomonas putida]
MSYCGPADLTLVYDQALALGHIIERPGIQLARANPSAPVSVLVDRRLGITQCEGSPLRRAVVVLLDGTVLSGPVQEIDATGDYFEIATVSHQRVGGLSAKPSRRPA